jgi:hypothetical protein
MRAFRNFLADETGATAIERDEIAARQAWLLSQYMPPRSKKLRGLDIKELFLLMKP